MIQKVTSIKLYEQVVEQIKNMILSGQYRKGELLPSEKELMELTGVSRITVRESIRILAEVGIIETHRGKGSIVLVEGKELILRDEGEEQFKNHKKNFQMATDTRILIEPEIAKQVAKVATEEDIVRLEACLVANRYSRANSIEGEELEGFHRNMINIVGNPLLVKIFNDITELEGNNQHTLLIPPAKQLTLKQKLNSQHENILEAIKNHDSEFAYFYMKEHLLFLKGIYTEYFDKFFELGGNHANREE